MRRATGMCGIEVITAAALLACSSSSGGAANPQDGGDGGATADVAPLPLTDAGATQPTSDASIDAMASAGCPVPSGSHALSALYTDADQILAMRLAQGALYFSDVHGVWSLPLTGGMPTPVASAAIGSSLVGPFAITSAQVVWADTGSGAFQPTLHARTLAGGAVTDLMAGSDLSSLADIEATDATAYALVINAMTLFSIPLNGSAPTTLASNTDLSGLLVAGSTLYFTNSFSGQPANELLGVSLPRGVPKALADVGQPGGGPMSTDGQNLYLASNLNQQYALQVYPLAGGSVTTLESSAYDASVFTSAGGHVYFAQPCGAMSSAYAVWEIQADKSNPHVDAANLDRPTAMVADASYVYVATSPSVLGSSQIQRFPR